jgi:hypothetical protein
MAPASAARRLLREPLLHFLLLGIAMFVLYGWLQRDLKAPDEIVVSRGQLQSLRAQFERLQQRQPTAPELQGLVDLWVREEVFYRAGLAMGIDRDDAIVRRRIAQKVEFAADAAAPAAPSDAELQAWLDEHADRYRIEARYSLRQVFFDPARRGERLQADVAAARRALEGGRAAGGDTTLLPAALDDARGFVVARSFGSVFEEALRTLPVGGWQGPVRSGFGWHLVELSARDDARQARLDEVRAAVERDWMQARASAAKEEFYARLRAQYNVVVEDGPPDAETAKP